MRVLVVTNPHKGMTVGTRIYDPKNIEETLSGAHAGHVVMTEEPDLKPIEAKPPIRRR